MGLAFEELTGDVRKPPMVTDDRYSGIGIGTRPPHRGAADPCNLSSWTSLNGTDMKLLLYGLQRSGTNFLETTLRKNFKVEFLNSNRLRSAPIHKHFRFYSNKNLIPEPQYKNDVSVESFQEFESLFSSAPERYLVMSKDPYSWFLSYKKWADKCDWPAADHHYAEEYNAFYKFFAQLSRETDRIIFVRYSDLLTDAEATLTRLAGEADMPRRKLSEWSGFNVPRKVSQSGSFDSEKARYYTEREFLNQLSDQEIQEINNTIDLDLMTFLGYEVATAR